ncbi:hypothetical protein [Ktedonobacter racemifer]|uniref:Uncharacterized protein n=1 Tax=Ktedonobacter racemifer DSM 44963 TaxID=485913 RepID=D6TC99_KTERA|nr:hypothetical protein [Ktedonobacter racemifer]EFH89916.1 hypothetical protein Krac_11505 [Ktedonobacter racemifer DSM 44963]
MIKITTKDAQAGYEEGRKQPCGDRPLNDQELANLIRDMTTKEELDEYQELRNVGFVLGVIDVVVLFDVKG